MSPRLRGAAVVVGEQLVEGDDVDQGQLAEELADVLDVHVHLVRDLFVGRGAVQARLELGDGALELAGLHPDRPRDPVGVAELVDDRAADAGHRVALELHLAGGLEAGDRVDQAERAVGDEVGLLDVRGQAAADPAGDVLHQRRVVEDQPVAQRRVAVGDVVGPQLREEGVGVLGRRRRTRRAGGWWPQARRAPRYWWSVLPCGPAPSGPLRRSYRQAVHPLRPGDALAHGPHGAARPSRACRSGSSRG